jgi:hypothetical protein
VRWHDDDRAILGALIRHLQRRNGTANTTLIGVLRDAIRIAAEYYDCLPKRFRRKEKTA